MSAPTHWWWIRHAPVPGGGTRIFGRRDVDCDVSDLAGLRALAGILPKGSTGIVSPLKRTRQTYDALIAAGASLPAPIVEPDLAEQSFGLWEGLSWPEMEAGDPATYAAFWADPTGQAPPGGESYAAMLERVAAAVAAITARHSGRDLVCVSHGGTIRAAVATALGLSPDTAMAIVIDNLTLTRISYVGGGLLRGRGGTWMIRGVNVPCRLP